MLFYFYQKYLSYLYLISVIILFFICVNDKWREMLTSVSDSGATCQRRTGHDDLTNFRLQFYTVVFRKCLPLWIVITFYITYTIIKSLGQLIGRVHMFTLLILFYNLDAATFRGINNCHLFLFKISSSPTILDLCSNKYLYIYPKFHNNGKIWVFFFFHVTGNV